MISLIGWFLSASLSCICPCRKLLSWVAQSEPIWYFCSAACADKYLARS